MFRRLNGFCLAGCIILGPILAPTSYGGESNYGPISSNGRTALGSRFRDFEEVLLGWLFCFDFFFYFLLGVLFLCIILVLLLLLILVLSLVFVILFIGFGSHASAISRGTHIDIRRIYGDGPWRDVPGGGRGCGVAGGCVLRRLDPGEGHQAAVAAVPATFGDRRQLGLISGAEAVEGATGTAGGAARIAGRAGRGGTEGHHIAGRIGAIVAGGIAARSGQIQPQTGAIVRRVELTAPAAVVVIRGIRVQRHFVTIFFYILQLKKKSHNTLGFQDHSLFLLC